jgi:3-oxoacyl-[acyl-carrier-protein] synthase-3
MSPSSTPKFKNPRAKYNFQGRTCSVAGVGAYVPERILTNAELEKLVNTTDEWITTRTGIKERHIAAKDEFTSDLATKAALSAMARARVKPEQIDLIVVATITPDMPFPSTACLVQRKIGAFRAAAFDLEAACSGFIYGLEVAQQFIMSRTYDTVLVIGAEKLSSIVDWKDKACVFFGDGAGAAGQNRPRPWSLTAVMVRTAASRILFMVGGEAAIQLRPNRFVPDAYLKMEGKETFKNACRRCNLRRKRSAAARSISPVLIVLFAPGQSPHHRRSGRTAGSKPNNSSSTFINSATLRPRWRLPRRGGYQRTRAGGDLSCWWFWGRFDREQRSSMVIAPLAALFLAGSPFDVLMLV